MSRRTYAAAERCNRNVSALHMHMHMHFIAFALRCRRTRFVWDVVSSFALRNSWTCRTAWQHGMAWHGIQRAAHAQHSSRQGHECSVARTNGRCGAVLCCAEALHTALLSAVLPQYSFHLVPLIVLSSAQRTIAAANAESYVVRCMVRAKSTSVLSAMEAVL
jgi:hypothetical protein